MPADGLDDNLALVSDKDGKVREWILDDFAYYFGPDAKKAKDFVYYPWDDEKGTCGAFTSHVGPNVWTKSAKVGWRTPVGGKIFWAGTEASDEWPGYFDGAVKAGQVAAKKVYQQFGWKIEGLRSIDATYCEDTKKT
ncbi:MAG TPA: FAD-dependent oxidoreductase [Thermoanaerobaculia bacterium]